MAAKDRKSLPDDDARLMLAVAEGSESAFELLVQRHQSSLLNFFRRMSADIHEAEDAAQETLIRVWRYRRRYRPAAPFSAFLFTLARHVWIDLTRRRGRNPSAAAPGLDSAGDPEIAAVDADRRMDLEGALAQLSPDHRMVLVLSVFHGLKYREIGEVVGVPEGTVKSRVFHATRHLRRVLKHGPKP